MSEGKVYKCIETQMYPGSNQEDTGVTPKLYHIQMHELGPVLP